MIERAMLIRYGEIHLKGQNRPFFERKLLTNIKGALKGFQGAVVEKTQGRYYVRQYREEDEQAVIEILKRIFGIQSISPMVFCDKDWGQICEVACAMMREQVLARGGACTFKVQSRRSDKTFPMNSMTMSPELGGVILEQVSGTTVNIHEYDVLLGLEIRERAVLYCEIIAGQGGMPTGCNGRGTLLLSGGIDSPVAGHMMMKRGLEIDCVHFHSFPYTSERAKEKVISLARILAKYCGRLQLFIVSITDFQLAVYEKCPDNLTTILLRRGMMQLTERIANDVESGGLITGEALGQVASQTLESLHCTNAAVKLPVLRPCIGFDKMEIVDRARAIGTFETSILPYEDCCTIFTPKHPMTKPTLQKVEESQLLLPEWDELLNQAYEKIEKLVVTP